MSNCASDPLPCHLLTLPSLYTGRRVLSYAIPLKVTFFFPTEQYFPLFTSGSGVYCGLVRPF